MSILRTQSSRQFLAANVNNAIRSIATTSPQLSKTPSLADVTPTAVPAFNAKQQEFRSKLDEQKKAQLQPSQSRTDGTTSSAVFPFNVPSSWPESVPAAPTAPDVSNASEITSLTLGLGKLSTAAEPLPNGDKPAGKLSSLIYGTAEGRKMDQEIEQSFSQVLARGKYVHSIVFHQVKPDAVDEYVELVGNWYPKVAADPDNKVHLVGSWRTEVGDSDTFGMTDYSSCTKFKRVLIYLQSTFGSTRSTMGITSRSILSLNTQSSQHSTRS